MHTHRHLATTFLLLAASCLHAQSTSRPNIQAPPPSTNIPHFPGDMDESDPFRENSRQRAREKERQKRIVDDANRLVKLTAQYRSDIEQHGTVTAEDQKLLLQIEKLAREVKDRMKGM